MGNSVVRQQAASPQRADPQRSKSLGSHGAACRETSSIHRLQRAVGNRAMNSLLRSRTIQPKLTVSHPEDESEREADRVADQVMRMPEPGPGLAVQMSQAKIQRACTQCEDELQRKTDFGHEPVPEEEKALVQAKLQAAPSAPSIDRKCESCEGEVQRKPQPKALEETSVAAMRET